MPRQNCSTNGDYRFRDGPFPRTRHRWLSSMLARAALRWAMVIARNITSGCGCAFQILLASQFVERFWLIWIPSLAPLWSPQRTPPSLRPSFAAARSILAATINSGKRVGKGGVFRMIRLSASRRARSPEYRFSEVRGAGARAAPAFARPMLPCALPPWLAWCRKPFAMTKGRERVARWALPGTRRSRWHGPRKLAGGRRAAGAAEPQDRLAAPRDRLNPCSLDRARAAQLSAKIARPAGPDARK
jgi:hypothetical protein